MGKIKESKNIFPCTLKEKGIPEEEYDSYSLYVRDEMAYWWQSYEEGEEVEEQLVIINNVNELKEAIDDFFDDPEMCAEGEIHFIPKGDVVKSILNTGKGEIFIYDDDQVDKDKDGWEVDDWKEKLAKKEPIGTTIITAIPAQNLELSLAESFEKAIKSLQKEGLFENVKSFDLDFNGKGINIKLNEMAYKDDYEEYNKKNKEYKNYRDRSWRQYSFVGNRLFKIDPVSFNFKGETFTIKNTYIGDESSRNLKKFTYTVAVVRGSEVLGEVRFDDWAATSRNERDLFQQVFDKADIPYKDKETFFKIFNENFNKFYESMNYQQSFEDNELYNKYRDNRNKKLDAFYRNNSNLQANAEKSWRQEHFGIGDYEVGQTVEVFDGRSGSIRSLGKIIKITPSGTATIQLEDGTTIVRRHIEDDANIELFRPVNYRNELVEPSISTEDVISNRKRNLGIE